MTGHYCTTQADAVRSTPAIGGRRQARQSLDLFLEPFLGDKHRRRQPDRLRLEAGLVDEARFVGHWESPSMAAARALS